jgi:hypothetical protein
MHIFHAWGLTKACGYYSAGDGLLKFAAPFENESTGHSIIRAYCIYE